MSRGVTVFTPGQQQQQQKQLHDFVEQVVGGGVVEKRLKTCLYNTRETSRPPSSVHPTQRIGGSTQHGLLLLAIQAWGNRGPSGAGPITMINTST